MKRKWRLRYGKELERKERKRGDFDPDTLCMFLESLIKKFKILKVSIDMMLSMYRARQWEPSAESNGIQWLLNPFFFPLGEVIPNRFHNFQEFMHKNKI